MEFKTIDDIKEHLNSIGFFIAFERGSEPVFKTGDNPRNFRRITPIEEERLINFIINNISNPFISIENNNIRPLARRINYNIINDYRKEQIRIDKLKKLHDKLNNVAYIYCSDNNNYYKVNDDETNKTGLFLIDKNLIPDHMEVYVCNHSFNYINEAFNFNGATNEFEEDYKKQVDEFNKIGVMSFKK